MKLEKAIEAMKLEKAIEALRAGKPIRHESWIGKARFIDISPLGMEFFRDCEMYQKGWELYDPETIKITVASGEQGKLIFKEVECEDVDIPGWPFPCALHRSECGMMWDVSCKVTGGEIASGFDKKKAIKRAKRKVKKATYNKKNRIIGQALVAIYKGMDGVTIEAK